MKIYYSERVWLSWWIWVLFIGMIVFFSSVIVLESFFGVIVFGKPAPTLLLLALVMVDVLILLAFGTFKIEVNSERIKVSYGVIKKTISLNEVVSSESTKARLRVYGGIGIRLGLDRSLAFTASTGNAIKIMRRNGRPFVFSTNNPGKLSIIINGVTGSGNREL